LGYKVFFNYVLVCGRDGKMKIITCMVCSKIEGKKKLLIPRLDFFLIKHLGLRKCSVTKLRIFINAYYVNPNNANVMNEKLYVSIGCDTVANLIEKVGKVEK
jgi:hypothetical protein